MKLKDRIINDFLVNDKRNFTIYQTQANELGMMYDKLIKSIKSGEDFKRFLRFENAITHEGKVKFDLTVDFFDKESKQTLHNQKVVFKYAIYSYFYSEIQAAMEKIKEKESLIPLPELA